MTRIRKGSNAQSSLFLSSTISDKWLCWCFWCWSTNLDYPLIYSQPETYCVEKPRLIGHFLFYHRVTSTDISPTVGQMGTNLMWTFIFPQKINLNVVIHCFVFFSNVTHNIFHVFSLAYCPLTIRLLNRSLVLSHVELSLGRTLNPALTCMCSLGFECRIQSVSACKVNV